MKLTMNARAFAALILFAALVVAKMNCWAGEISSTNPHLFRAAEDPQVLIFGTGNDALLSFVKADSPRRSVLSYNQDIYPSADLMELWNPLYDFSPFADDAESTEGPGYWIRLHQLLYQSASIGRDADCRVTKHLLELTRRQKDGMKRFVRQFEKSIRGAAFPLLSIDLPLSEAEEVRAHFLQAWPGLLVGKVVRQLEELGASAHFDFVIVYEDAVPVTWRGQTSVPFVQSRIPQKPVIMALLKPRFFQELFWLSSGAAGLQHDELPPTGTRENHTAWVNLRAITSFGTSLSRGLRLDFSLLQPGLIAALGGANNSIFLLPRPGRPVGYQLQGGLLEQPAYLAGWYNPQTDQTVILPRAELPRDRNIRLDSPTRDPWIYWHVPVLPETDAESTTTAILPDPDFLIPDAMGGAE